MRLTRRRHSGSTVATAQQHDGLPRIEKPKSILFGGDHQRVHGRPQRIAAGAQRELGDAGREHGRHDEADDHGGARNVEWVPHEALHDPAPRSGHTERRVHGRVGGRAGTTPGP